MKTAKTITMCITLCIFLMPLPAKGMAPGALTEDRYSDSFDAYYADENTGLLDTVFGAGTHRDVRRWDEQTTFCKSRHCPRQCRCTLPAYMLGAWNTLFGGLTVWSFLPCTDKCLPVAFKVIVSTLFAGNSAVNGVYWWDRLHRKPKETAAIRLRTMAIASNSSGDSGDLRVNRLPIAKPTDDGGGIGKLTSTSYSDIED